MIEKLHTGITEGIIAVTNHVNRLEDYDNLKGRLSEKWVTVKSLNKRLNTIMNVRQDEQCMRRLIIDMQLELQK